MKNDKESQLIWEAYRGNSLSTLARTETIWHLTDMSRFEEIEQEGMLFPQSVGTRGVSYKSARLFFFTSIQQDDLEEIESLVRFGGIDMDDDELTNSRANAPLMLLEFNVSEIDGCDSDMDMVRQWYPDATCSPGLGVWTPQPVPYQDKARQI